MKRKVFISSTYASNKLLRTRLAGELEAEGFQVVIAEGTGRASGFVTHDLLARSDIIEVSDRCLSELASSDVIVCILSGGLGSSIRLEDALFRAKHFEVELFSALMQGKPIFLCSLPSFEPDPDTREFVRCLTEDRLVRPMHGEDDLIASALRYCESALHGELNQQQRDNSLPLRKGLSILRASYRSTRSHKMFLPFLGNIVIEGMPPDLDAAQQALSEAEGQEDLHLRISRLWIALRELLPSVPHSTNDPRAAALWERLLSNWVGTSSWYGLHAHVHLGAVAAATGLWNVRARDLAKNKRDVSHQGMPVGSVASANYSLIQHIPSLPIQYLAFRTLRRFIDKNMSLSPKSGENLLIRGSINMRLMNPLASEADFRDALRLLESGNAKAQTIADAKVHLAVPLAYLGRRGEARSLVDEGLSQMRDRVEPGALLRALRKAIQIERLPFGDRERSTAFSKEAQELAKAEKGYLDQIRHFPKKGSRAAQKKGEPNGNTSE